MAPSHGFCYVCWSNELSVKDGVLVCDVCGTQAQGDLEEQEFQQGIDDARGKKKIRATTTQATIGATANVELQEQRAKSDLRAATLTYCAALQRLLQAQAAALVSRFGVNPQVESVMRQLWLALLPRTGILEPNYYMRPNQGNDASGDATVEANPQAQPRDDDPGTAAAAAQAAKPLRLRAALWRRLAPQVTLRITFLSCHLLREAITPGDIIAWAASGQLPYFQLPAIAAEVAAAGIPAGSVTAGNVTAGSVAAGGVTAGASSGAAAPPIAGGPPLPALCVTPQIFDTPMRLAARAQGLAATLGLQQLPPVNGEALLQRAALELELPTGVLAAAEQLLRVHLVGRRALLLPSSKPRSEPRHEHAWEARQPHSAVVALLLVAVKLLYGLGSGGAGAGAASGRSGLAGAPAAPASWQEWAAQALLRLEAVRGEVPVARETVAALEGPAADRYLQYCLRVMFAQQEAAAGSGGAGGGTNEGDGGLGEFRQMFLGLWEDALAERQHRQEQQQLLQAGGGMEWDGDLLQQGQQRQGQQQQGQRQQAQQQHGQQQQAQQQGQQQGQQQEGQQGGQQQGQQQQQQQGQQQEGQQGGQQQGVVRQQGGQNLGDEDHRGHSHLDGHAGNRAGEQQPGAPGREGLSNPSEEDGPGYALADGLGREHPDYAVLLAVFSAYARVAPAAMHKQVLQVERLVVDVEAAVQLQGVARA